MEWKTAAQTWAQAATAGQSATPAADATGHEITGLTNDTAYTVRVRAANDAGNGPWSAEESETPVSTITQVTVEFGAASYTATEGGAAATVTVNLSADPERSVTIPITAAGAGGATAGDYTLSANSVTIAGGSTSATFTVTATDDSVDDDGESVNLSFGTLPDEVSEGTQRTATVSLTDNDGTMPVAVTVEFDAASYTAIEGRGAVTITVTLSTDPERSVTIPITVTENGGANTSDYSLSANSVIINSGDTSATFTVTATDDDIYDGDGNDEALTLGFGTPPDAVSEGNQATTDVSLIDNEVVVSSDLAPGGTAIGGGFRLLFLTNDKRNANSSDISDYDSHIQGDITRNGSDEIKDYLELFRVLGSTRDVDARDHTGTTHTSADKGLPIWWVEGPRAADDYQDFYDGSWDHRDPGRRSDGDEFDFPSDFNVFTAGVWTGTRSNGTEAVSGGSGAGLGRSNVAVGLPGQGAGSELLSTISSSRDPRLWFYGLSFVLRAAAPTDTPYVTGVVVDPEPANGKYKTNDTITVEVTFSEAVSLSGTGTPTFPLEIGANTRDADYDSANSTDTVLVFTYEVSGDDTDLNGISSTARTFDLPSTASITRLNESAVAAHLGPIVLSTDFRVNAPPRITGIEVTSTPKANPSNDTYGLGEDIEITVTFSEAVNVTGDEVEGDVDFGISVSGPRRAPLKSGNGTTELVFAYTVQSGDTDDNGIFIVDHTHSTNPTFFELQGDQSVVGVDSGRDALLEHERPGAQPDHKVDGSLTVADATLSALSLSGITLVPAFAAGTTAYAATTSLSTTTVTIAISQGQNGATGRITAPTDADLNASGHQVTLAEDADTTITVTVTSSNGDSTRTYTVTVTREAANGNRSTPPPPKNVRAVEEKGGVRLTWQPPDGAAVTGYRIERRRADEDRSGPQRSAGSPGDNHTLVEDTGNADTGYTDESAEQGVEYEYRVSARNESGAGAESDWVRAGPASASNNPATGAPTISGTAQVGQTLTAGISGIADADGLSGETFTYQWVSGDGTTDTDTENATGSTYTLAAADQGRSVKVRVTFTDDGGNEETLTSAPTGPVWGDGPPGAPRNLTAAVGNKEVTLSWDPPEDNGNAPATGYRIEWRVDGKDYDKTIWGTAQSTTYKTNDRANLANGVKYFFRVKAENGGGNSYGPYGPASGEVSATPTSGSAVDLGTPVLSDTENLHHGMVKLDWEDIEDAGWYVVQYYHIDGGSGEWLDLPALGVDIAFHGSSAVVSNLDYGIHWLRVGAASCAGASEWSQIEELIGTRASDWKGVPVPEVEEGDEIEPCPVVLGTPVLSEPENLHHGMVRLDWQDIEEAGWYVVQYYHLQGGEWLDLPAEGVEITFHGSTAVVSNLHGLSWLRVGAASCAGESEWSQIEELYGTNASDWEGVPVPEEAEGDQIEPCSEDLDTSDNSPATGLPTISGTAQVGETLTADITGIADPDGLGDVQYEYQWMADTADISGATNATYTLTDSEESKAIKVEVSFTDDAGNNETLTSAATASVAAEPASNSPATGTPTISGTIQVGATLTANPSRVADADGLTNVSYSYQWLADDAAIAGATGFTYTLVAADEGKAIRVEVRFTDDADNEETLTSAATDAVSAALAANSPATGAPAITGTAQVGETLTADTSGIADADGLGNVRYEYQWLADDAEIAGVTISTYTLAAADEGKTIKVRVRFTDDAGNDESLTSAATEAVAAAEPAEPPDRPRGLSATASHDSVTLTWDDPQDDSITGYVILRRLPGVDAEGHFDELVADTGTAATTYTDSSVEAETRYTYRIKAINEHGTSERSRWSHIDTPAAP